MGMKKPPTQKAANAFYHPPLQYVNVIGSSLFLFFSIIIRLIALRAHTSDTLLLDFSIVELSKLSKSTQKMPSFVSLEPKAYQALFN